MCLLDTPNEPCCRPGVGIVSLVPVYEGLSACDARMRGPGSTQHYVVLAVKKVVSVTRV